MTAIGTIRLFYLHNFYKYLFSITVTLLVLVFRILLINSLDKIIVSIAILSDDQ